MIELKGVWKSFDNKEVLTGLNLHIPRGETLVIMGRSGCGKSVALKIITGLLKPEKGEVWVDGEDVTQLNRKRLNQIRRKFGMLFQSAALFDSMTVEENVGFMLSQHTRLSQEEIQEIVAEKLRLVDLEGTEALRPAELSGGMRKRVGLARAIAFNPDVILYDEPTAGLDPIMCQEINRLIRSLHEKLQVTSVVVTHDMQSAFSVGTKITMMHDGQIIVYGSPEDIRHSDSSIVQEFISGGNSGVAA